MAALVVGSHDAAGNPWLGPTTGRGDPMAMTTRLTERLGVRHPIMLAPMDIVSDARLAGAVSRADPG